MKKYETSHKKMSDREGPVRDHKVTTYVSMESLYGWRLSCDFMSFLTVLQSDQYNGRLIMKGCVQCNTFTIGKISTYSGSKTSDC